MRNVKGSSSVKRKITPDRNTDLHKELKHVLWLQWNKLNINNKNISTESPNISKLNNITVNNPRVKEESNRKIGTEQDPPTPTPVPSTKLSS